MRRVFVIAGMLIMAGLSPGLLRAQEGYVEPGPVVAHGLGPIAEVGPAAECVSAPRCSHCGKWKAYKASFGCFNCACRGSYKYPVPPLSTYFWPGMYSQPAMTAYVSPYRFPLLNLPPEAGLPSPPVKVPKVGRINRANHTQVMPDPAGEP